MELSWDTFVLEIINFVVLIWILKHFLYKPVLDVIAKRKAGINKRINDAETLHKEAEQLREKYEGRVAEWESERRQAKQYLTDELEIERSEKLKELHSTLAQERKKAAAIEQQRKHDAVEEIEASALKLGAQFASRILKQASGPEMENQLIELAIMDLSKLPEARIEELAQNNNGASDSITISTAFAVSDKQRQQLNDVLSNTLHLSAPVQYQIDTTLLAGMEITVGAWVLATNVRDELQGFTQIYSND